tara:strand:+ start:714 stop:1160 length:447 start_codon:yes stop_codon:yes gene_type:complete
MLKKFLIFSVLTLSTHHFVKADLQDSLNQKSILNETDCTWESSEFSDYERDYLNNKSSIKDSIRYCVDYKNNTVFSLSKGNKNYDPKRVNGFLNYGELTESGLGYYFIYQFEIEANELVRYSCKADGPNSVECANKENVGKWIYGIKR